MATVFVKDSVLSNRTACLKVALPVSGKELREAVLREFKMPIDIDVHLMHGSKELTKGLLDISKG